MISDISHAEERAEAGCLSLTQGGAAACSSYPKTIPVSIAQVRPNAEARRNLSSELAAIGDAIARVTRIRASFEFYRDGVYANAQATIRDCPPGTDGRVLIGWGLISALLACPDNSFLLASVLAHEVGHIHQLRAGMCESLAALDLNVARLELHADYLCGIILQRANVAIPQAAASVLLDGWRKLGDVEYTSVDHHGTSEERVTWFMEGFNAGSATTSSFYQLAAKGAEAVAAFQIKRH